MARKDPIKAQKVRQDIKKWDDYWRLNNEQYHEYTDFVMGNQWKEDESRLFERYNKIPLTFNKLAPLVNHILGEQRQNTPNLQVTPDNSVSEQTAEVREALIKNITFDSDSKVVFQNAFQSALIGGFGALRVDTEYNNDYTFDQDIVFRKINDPTRCYWDVSAENTCKTDGMFAGFRTKISRKKFASIYGKKIERMIGTAIYEDDGASFFDDDSITIINHYERKYERVKLVQLSNGDIVEPDEFAKLERVMINDVEMYIRHGEPVYVEKERDSYRYKIKYFKIAGDYILESTDFPSEQLPVVFLDQNSYIDKSQKQICRPFIKDAKDAQRYINYLGTQSAYLMKVSRYDQFIASKANVKSPDTQTIWRDPATVQGALIYDESPNGNRPERLQPPELSQSLLQQYQRAMADIQSSTGMYNAQLGDQGNEISGAAIDSRTKRGAYNTYVPFDSLNRVLTCCGQIVNEMIPRVYDTERMVTLTMKDGNVRPIMINEQADEYGALIKNDMTKGQYKIRLLPGPSYEGQKAEALDSLNMLLTADKTGQVFPLIADLYVENLPLANNLELRNRLRTIVPQDIIEAGKTGKPLPPKPPQPDPNQQMAALQQQALQAETNLKIQMLAQKERELQMKAAQYQNDLQLEMQKLENERLSIVNQAQDQRLRFASELHRTDVDAQINHADNMVKILTHHPKHLEPQRI